MEPFAFTNAQPIRDRCGASMTIPTAVCWSGELEWVLMLKDETIDTYLFGLLTDPAKAGYDVSADLVGIELGRNAVLDEAWDKPRRRSPVNPRAPRPGALSRRPARPRRL